MVRLVCLIAALAAPATAAVHAAFAANLGSLEITQPQRLTAVLDAKGGYVYYRGRYQVVINGGDPMHVYSTGGSEGVWSVTQQFDLPFPGGPHLPIPGGLPGALPAASPTTCLHMDYSTLGVFGHTGWEERVGFSPTLKHGSPRVVIVLGTTIAVTFTKPGTEQAKYALQREGLLNIEGNKAKILASLENIHLVNGRLIVPRGRGGFYKIRPDLGEIVINNKSYIRSS